MTTRNHRSRAPLTVALMAVLAAGLTACLDHDEAVIIEPAGGELFKRYVALGNSVTTGFQSGGVNLQLQADAYPVLLAAKANAPFGIPELAMPGCPPPLVGPLTSTRIDTVSCNLRTFDAPNPVQNLAVPGANTGDISDPLGTGTLLNTLILGGRTQIGAMQDAEPTLVSVWIGNNDALGATLSGDPSALTPVATFEAEYDEIVAGITTAGPQDAILIGAADPMIVAPALQPGAYFWAIAQNPPPGLPTLNVSSNCAPFDLSGNPNPLAFRLVSFIGVANAIAAGEDPITIDCVDGVQVNGAFTPDYLIDEVERSTIATRIATFNAYIEQQATANGWMYIDPTAMIVPALADPDRIRKCQDLASATDAQSFAAAVQSSCPVDLDPSTETTFFGSFFSFDGIHPSAAAHAVIADTLAGRLNAAYGLSLPTN